MTDPTASVTALRRFHLGAPDAPAGEVPTGAVPAALDPVAAEEASFEGRPTALALLRDAVTESQADARAAFARQARELAARAEALLETERRKGAEGRDPQRLDGALGAAGRFLDSSALAGVLGAPRRAAALDGERVRRLEEAVAVLREAAGQVEAPEPVLVHDGTLAWAAGGAFAQDWSALESADPCAVAADLFDQASGRAASVLLAARRVRLEAAGEYDPARHDLLLGGGLDWQAFNREELALVPPVVALESADELAARGMVSLSKLLLSGRPVQVLLVDDPTGAPGSGSTSEGLAAFRLQPAYLGLAQREAFVQQGSLARADLLAAGFRRAAAGCRAGLHVVDAPEDPALSAAAIAGRAHPLFQYDPEAGASWAERMDFSGNPDPAEDWPSRQVGADDGQGAEIVPAAFTFADVCLLVPDFAGHFLPVPDDVPAEALATVPEWLALPAAEALERVPYVLAVVASPRPARRLVRLAVSRPLALACRDRLGYWRTLQELAGVRSEYVRRAEVRTREEADVRLAEERERLAERHAAELERVRRRAVEDVVNRLTAAVLGVDGAAFESPLAPLAGRDVEDVSAELLEMVAGVDPDQAEPGDVDGPAKAAVDQVMAELTGLLGSLDAVADEALGTMVMAKAGGRERN
jgi:hypothetical protein